MNINNLNQYSTKMKLRTFMIAAIAAVFTALSVSADEPFRLHRYDSFMAGRVTPQSIVFVGNSITNMGLWAETFGDDARCLNRGNSGAVSSETLENIESVLIGHPAKIFLMIGTNDLGSSYSDEIPFANVSAILSRIQDESPETDIYLTSVFPSTVGTRSLENISALNKKYQTLVDNKKVHYLDLYDDLMGITTGEFSFDKLHMGPVGYKIWCDKAAQISGDETLVSSLIDKDQMSSNACGLSGSNGMRTQMFCELPSYANDVWIFGDEMVNGGEWNELLGGLATVKNRGWNWGYGGLTITNYTTVMENLLSTDSNKMTKEAPKQIFFYVGTNELSNSTAVATVKERYRALIEKTKSVAPSTQLFIMSLTPHGTKATNTLTQSYNEQFAALASETGATYVDIFTPLADGNLSPSSEYMNSNYVYGKGYNKIAQIIGKYIDGANPLSDDEFDAQYAAIKARNVLGKAVASAKPLLQSDNVSETYLANLQSEVDAAKKLLQGETVQASVYEAQAETLNDLSSAIQIIAEGGSSDSRVSFKEKLAAIESAVEAANIGDDLGQYSLTYDGWSDDLAAVKAMLADGSNNYNELECALLISRLQSAVDGLSINLPQPGRYIRVKASQAYVNSSSYASTFNGVATYLSSACKQNTVNSGTDWQAVCVNSKTDDNEASTIFYYEPVAGSEYGHLVSYDEGRYAYTGKGNMLGFHQGSADENAGVATIVGFQAALAESGAYHFRYNIQGTSIESARVLSCSGNGSVVNGGSATAEKLKSYVWSNVELEYVYELPVTIDTDGRASFAAPVAVTVPNESGVEFFVVTHSNGVLKIHQVSPGETYAAGTAFLINGAAGAKVQFAVKYDASDADASYLNESVRSSVALDSHVAVNGITSFAKTNAAVETRTDASTIAFAALADGDDVKANSSVIDVPTSKLCAQTASSFNVPLSKGVDGGDLYFDLSKNAETDGVNAIVVERLNGKNIIYDLQGRSVNNPQTGQIYVVNGELKKL